MPTFDWRLLDDATYPRCLPSKTGGLVQWWMIVAFFFLWPLRVDAFQDPILFRFGDTTVVLERGLVRDQPYPQQLSRVEWANAQEYRLKEGESVYFRIPLDDILSADSTCRNLGVIGLRYGSLPARGSKGDRNRLDLLSAVPTQFPDISRLISSNAKRAVLDWYQFEADDLRDYWGDKQSFANGDPTIILAIQIARNVAIRAAPNADGCFYRDGVALTRHIRDFVLSRLQTR